MVYVSSRSFVRGHGILQSRLEKGMGQFTEDRNTKVSVDVSYN
jgi:hypothetical protein